MTPLTYCERCKSPIYRLKHLETGNEMAVDWLPVAYGFHVVRLSQAERTADQTIKRHTYQAPKPDALFTSGARYVVDRVEGVCWLEWESEADPARLIYHQDHSVTCDVWSAQANINRHYRPSAWKRDQEALEAERVSERAGEVQP